MKQQMLLTRSILALSTLCLMNCGKVSFGKDVSAPVKGAEGGGASDGSSSGGSVNQPGTTNPGDTTGGTPTPTTGIGNTPAVILPKVQFIGPPCQRLSQCEIEFRLDKAYADNTEFNWRTDDQGTVCSTEPPIAPEICGRPNIEYKPNFGRVVFPAGETSVKVYVQNINSANVPVRIDVIMSQCQYGTLSEGCSKFFN